MYELYGYHLEADTRVAFHALLANSVNHSVSINYVNIVTCGNDSDILVILTCNADKFSSNIWLDTRLDYKNSPRSIIIKSLSQFLCCSQSINGIYAFTGIDCIPSFHGKSKVRPIKLLESQTKFLNAFKDIDEKEIDDSIANVTKEFVFHLDSYKKQANIHQVLPLLFEAK